MLILRGTTFLSPDLVRAILVPIMAGRSTASQPPIARSDAISSDEPTIDTLIRSSDTIA